MRPSLGIRGRQKAIAIGGDEVGVSCVRGRISRTFESFYSRTSGLLDIRCEVGWICFYVVSLTAFDGRSILQTQTTACFAYST